jgi:hypothetical protein
MDYTPKYDKSVEEDNAALQIKTLKQNALFNLDFDEYKRQVRNELKMLQNNLSKSDYVINSDTIVNNDLAQSPFLITGIILIIVAFILIILS